MTHFSAVSVRINSHAPILAPLVTCLENPTIVLVFVAVDLLLHFRFSAPFSAWISCYVVSCEKQTKYVTFRSVCYC